MRAQLLRKGKKSRGQYEENEEEYGNQQYFFKQEDGKHIHANVNSKHGNVQVFSPLRVGDWIEGYKMLWNNPDIIDPRTTFTVIADKKKGGPPLF